MTSRAHGVSSFDKSNLTTALSRLPTRHRMAFAAACAERLLPLYEQFMSTTKFGDLKVLRDAVDLVWNFIKGQGRIEQLRSAQRSVEAVTPNTEDFGSSLASRALDAASAVAQAIDTCLEPSATTAVETAEIAWECSFGIEQALLFDDESLRLSIDPRLHDAARGGFVQLEERMQRDSIAALADCELSGTDVDHLRDRYAHLS